MISRATKPRRRSELVTLLSDYKRRHVAVAWQGGEPIYIKTGGLNR